MVICSVHWNVVYRDSGMHPDLFMFGMLLTSHLNMARLDHSAAITFMKSIGPEFLTQAVHCNLQQCKSPDLKLRLKLYSV